MNKLETSLMKIKQMHERHKVAALMTHVVLGYPTLEISVEIIKLMAISGAQIIEVQIPFSDPIADGQSIMSANHIALNAGVTPQDCLSAIRNISNDLNVPVLAMTYFNIPFSYKEGVRGFCKAAHEAGIEGLIIPDLPPEEFKTEKILELSLENSLSFIPLLSPLSSETRLQKIAKAHPASRSQFAYCVSSTGTTGARDLLPSHIPEYIDRVRKYFSCPLALGFGISTPEHISTVGNYVEIAIVGSATIDVIRKQLLISQADTTALLKEVGDYISGLSSFFRKAQLLPQTSVCPGVTHSLE